MEGRLRWVQKGYGGCTLSYQIRPGRRQMSSNHGAECNRGNRPFIMTSARLSTTARGAAHRRKWLISGPERALRCGAPARPLPAAHLSKRWPEARWPSCESVDERTGVWSWPAPRVQPDVLLDVGVGPERAQGGRNPPQRTVSRAGGVEPARIRAGERAARGSIFAANSSSVSCSRRAFGGATSRRVPSPMTIRPTVHQPAPGCRPRVTGWSPRSRPALGWEMPSPASHAVENPQDPDTLEATTEGSTHSGARRRCAIKVACAGPLHPRQPRSSPACISVLRSGPRHATKQRSERRRSRGAGSVGSGGSGSPAAKRACAARPGGGEPGLSGALRRRGGPS